jgi:ankyrin repeat protein
MDNSFNNRVYKIKDYSYLIFGYIDKFILKEIYSFLFNLEKRCPDPKNWNMNRNFLFDPLGFSYLTILHFFSKKVCLYNVDYNYQDLNLIYLIFEKFLKFGADPNIIHLYRTPYLNIILSDKFSLRYKYLLLSLFVNYDFDINLKYAHFGHLINCVPDVDNKYTYKMLDIIMNKMVVIDCSENIYYYPLFRFKNSNILEYLIKKGFNPLVLDNIKNNLIHLLFKNCIKRKNTDLFQTLKTLLKYIPFKEIKNNCYGEHPIHTFTIDNKEFLHKDYQKCLEYFLNLGIDINLSAEQSGGNILFFCNLIQTVDCISRTVYKNSFKMFEIALKNGADINHVGFGDKTVGFKSTVKTLSFLLKKGLNPNKTDKEGKNLMQQLLHYFNYHFFSPNQLTILETKIFQLIFKGGIDLNHKDNNGDTALHYIIKNDFFRYYTIFEIFYYSGGNLSIRNNEGKNSLYYANEKELTNLLQISFEMDKKELIEDILLNIKKESYDYLLEMCKNVETKNLLYNKITDYISVKNNEITDILSYRGIGEDISKFLIFKMIYP